MGKYSLPEIGNIISKNPNKRRLDEARRLNAKMMLHLHGTGMKNALAQMQYFENADIYKSRREYALSNVDLFERVLNEEQQIFTARGGSAYFNLPEHQEQEMHGHLADVVYGMSLRRWVATFGINAYRADPMGVIFMEAERCSDDSGYEGSDNNGSAGSSVPRCYPVYKSTADIWDYLPNGRRLEYVCFTLTDDELELYGIEPKSDAAGEVGSRAGVKQPAQHKYFRFVDDGQDIIVMRQDSSGSVVQVDLKNGYSNPIVGLWNRVPGFIVSDLVRFSDPGSFDTPLSKVVELADAFLTDRSIKNLQQKYHGFAKAFEPLIRCFTCNGEGYVKGSACPDCTAPGQDKGTGIKMRTTIADVFKIPMDMLTQDKAPNFDAKRIYGYITPDIASWNKQDESLEALEGRLYRTYWGTCSTHVQGYNGSQGTHETATKTLVNLQPKYAVLNRTADWAEQTERMIANMYQEFYYGVEAPQSNITYGRDYILQTPEEILAEYYGMKANGVSDSMLDNQYEKYIKSLYQANPVQETVYRKKFDVEPFPHITAAEVEASEVVLPIDKLCKRYFGEWDDTLSDAEWVVRDVAELKRMLVDFVSCKS